MIIGKPLPDLGQHSWTVVAVSDEQEVIYAAYNDFVSNTTFNVALLKSTDQGFTWKEVPFFSSADFPAKSLNIVSLSTSSNGSVVAVANYNGFIYISKDSGLSWTESYSGGERYWTSLKVSSSGVYIAAVAYNDYLYISPNSGVTWDSNENLAPKPWLSVTMTRNGDVVYGCAHNEGIYIGRRALPTTAPTIRPTVVVSILRERKTLPNESDIDACFNFSFTFVTVILCVIFIGLYLRKVVVNHDPVLANSVVNLELKPFAIHYTGLPVSYGASEYTEGPIILG